MDINHPGNPKQLHEKRVGYLVRLISAAPTRGALYEEYTSSESLGDMLTQCIDEALTDLLGKRTREAVFDNLERNRGLSRNDIPDHLNDFFDLMERTFGKGSKTIGKSIIKKMFSKLDWDFVEIPAYDFQDYLEAIRKRITRAVIDQLNSCPNIPQTISGPLKPSN
jgi:hypothetical protein